MVGISRTPGGASLHIAPKRHTTTHAMDAARTIYICSHRFAGAGCALSDCVCVFLAFEDSENYRREIQRTKKDNTRTLVKKRFHSNGKRSFNWAPNFKRDSLRRLYSDIGAASNILLYNTIEWIQQSMTCVIRSPTLLIYDLFALGADSINVPPRAELPHYKQLCICAHVNRYDK